jgi:hypothetical protein
LRSHCISHHLQNLPFGSFAQFNETISRSSLIFYLFKNSFHFSPGQVAHYN